MCSRPLRPPPRRLSRRCRKGIEPKATFIGAAIAVIDYRHFLDVVQLDHPDLVSGGGVGTGELCDTAASGAPAAETWHIHWSASGREELHRIVHQPVAMQVIARRTRQVSGPCERGERRRGYRSCALAHILPPFTFRPLPHFLSRRRLPALHWDPNGASILPSGRALRPYLGPPETTGFERGDAHDPGPF